MHMLKGTVTKRKKFRLAALSLVCAAAMLTAPWSAYATSNGSSAASGSSSSSKDQLAALNSQQADLKKQQDALNAKISQAKSELEKQQLIKENSSYQITLTKQQIDLLEDKIVLINENIDEKETEIAEKEEEISQTQNKIDENYELLKKRLRSMYTTGRSSTLGLLLGADSFTDFLTQADRLKRIAEHDRELIESLSADKEALNAAKAEVEAAKAEVEENKAEIESEKAQVESLRSQYQNQVQQAESQIQDIQALQAQMEADTAKLQAEMKQVQAEIDAIYAANVSQGEYVGGNFGWPLPGYTYISSYFGWRFNNTDFHTGIDITGGNVYGKSIVASNAGTVMHVQRTYTPNKGYGMYVIVDHGGGYTTLYGHMSNIVVNVGDVVSRGQKIGEVGSTGWSTGPHLHFEIRVNGEAINPLTELK